MKHEQREALCASVLDPLIEREEARRAGGGPAATEPSVILTRGSEITPVPIKWLWHFWIALGKLLILAGAPGAGKTTIALAFAATITSGGRWPDGSRSDIGSVIIWSGEDDPADTLVPRLTAMGADMSRIFFITGSRNGAEVLPFDPSRDMSDIEAHSEQIGDVKMIIVDPVVSVVAGDSHKNAEVRRGLQPLVDLGSRIGAAVVGITHLSKGTAGRDPTERVTGSIAFSAVARVVLLAARMKTEDGGERRILARAKANICPDDGGFEYFVEQTEATPGIPTSMVAWGKAIEGTARDLLAQAEDEPTDAGNAMDSAEEFLRELLVGPTPTKTVQAEAKAAGHSWATVRRASDAIKVIKRKSADGWYWQLPQVRGARIFNLLTQKHEQVGQVEHVEHLGIGQLAQGAQDAQLSQSQLVEQVGVSEGNLGGEL